MSDERSAIEWKKADWAAVPGHTVCSSVIDSVGPFDLTWEDSGAIFHRKYNYRTLNDYRRKPVGFNWSRKPNVPDAKCAPLSASDYVYSQRTLACADGWYADEAPETAFCARNEPVEDTSCPVCNPVLPGLGIKLHSEADYVGSGAHPLNFTRLYRSRWPTGINEGGRYWTHNWASEIVEIVGAPTRTVRTMRSDGAVRSFTQAKRIAGQAPPPWQPDPGYHDQLTEQLDGSGQTIGWTLRAFADDSVETYSASGKLLSVRQRNGWTMTLMYGNAASPGQLTAVTNQFGRQLKLVYDSAGRLSQLVPPGAVQDAGPGSASSPIRYAYEELGSIGPGVPSAKQLTSVTWQDGAVKRYHYEDARFPNALSGLTDEMGVRVASYAYDTTGRVSQESKAGGVDRVSFSYGGTTSMQLTEYSTSASGTVHAYGFSARAGLVRPTSLTSPCALCGDAPASITYGDGSAANGGAGALGQRTRTVGHDRTITFYQYDALGRETERAVYGSAYQYNTTRPMLNVATGVTTTAWHATWNLPVQVAEPGKITAYVYDANGNLTGQSWNATTDATGALAFAATKAGSTFATGWGYDSVGLNTSVVQKTDVTETGRWTLGYALSDLATVTDVTNNRTATMTQYDARGNMLSGTTDMGVQIGLSYSPRGYITRKSVNGQPVVFTLNAAGSMTRVQTPDGQTIDYVLDANQRLVEVRLNGVTITSQMLEQADRLPDTPLRMQIEKARVWLAKAVESMVPEAQAQVFVVPGGKGSGQPEYDPRTDMLMVPMTGADRALRKAVENLARACQCDPNGGYLKPTLTNGTRAHLLWGGHLGPMFTDQSYFTVPVDQALVDEVVARAWATGVVPQREGTTDVYRVIDMPRTIGMARSNISTPGFFQTTSKVRLIVEKSNCGSMSRRDNEIVTIYPVN